MASTLTLNCQIQQIGKKAKLSKLHNLSLQPAKYIVCTPNFFLESIRLFINGVTTTSYKGPMNYVIPRTAMLTLEDTREPFPNLLWIDQLVMKE